MTGRPQRACGGNAFASTRTLGRKVQCRPASRSPEIKLPARVAKHRNGATLGFALVTCIPELCGNEGRRSAMPHLRCEGQRQYEQAHARPAARISLKED